ncbi:histone-lysine N-methyltransferase SUVR3-like [Phalaenopsis equestris]|uniref:histone-lysine N-methyltransferase SUVR3-like n=1 Tax=Phalaenopsis equestris TaxID=78828 RepID=UPI0009E2B19E|nr:histone-lysine N-methyltransferase SUVR3-like [Phalaenopsis equestris]
MKKPRTCESESLEQWAILVLPFLPPSALSAAAATCRSLRRIAAAINSRRMADAARGLEIYPIPFHNPTSDPIPYSYFLYSSSSFTFPRPHFSQSWGGSPSKHVANSFSLADFISSVAEVSFFSGCECINCSFDGICPCSGFDDGGGIGIGSLGECGADCSCGLDCVNRITQRGIGVRVKIVRHLKKGWGLHADQVLNRGEFICEYAGIIKLLNFCQDFESFLSRQSDAFV